VGVNSAIFSIVDIALIRPLPFEDPDRLVYIQTKSSKFQGISVSYSDFLDWKSQSRSFTDMAVSRRFNFNMTGRGIPSLLAGNMVSSSYFKVLGVPPLKGRDFQDDDDRRGANRVAIIGYALWEVRFGKDENIVGQILTLDDQPYTIIGVAPKSQAVAQTAVWVPIGLFADQDLRDRNHRYSRVYARLAPGVSEAQAQAEMDGVARRLASDYPISNNGFGVRVVQMSEFLVGGTRKTYLLLLLASSVILLLGCIHVTTVQVAGVMERQKELSVRLALGASRFRLLRQLMIEVVLLASVSAIIGLVAAHISTTVIVNRYAFLLPVLLESSIDPAVVWFTVLAALVSTSLAYLIPGVYAVNVNIVSALKGESPFSALSRFPSVGRFASVVFQVSVTLALCLSSGLLIKSLYRVVAVDLGFRPQQVLVCYMSLPAARYPSQEKVADFYDRLVPVLKAVPGVQSATIISRLPLTGAYNAVPIEFAGRNESLPAAERPTVDVLEVLPGYFSTLQIPLFQGRDFNENDHKDAPMVAVVDDVLAAKIWPRQNALGQRLRLADPGDASAPWLEVIGVVRQVKQYGPEQAVPRMQVYVPIRQEKHSAPTVAAVVRFDRDVTLVRTGIQQAVYGMDQELWLNAFQTLDSLYHVSEGRRKVSTALISSFAGLGILLGILGIYGAVASAVVRMRRELAVRIALGSTRSQAIVTLMKWIFVSLGVGLSIGILLAFSLKKILASFIFGVGALDPGVYLTACSFVVVLCLAASLIPAWRSVRRVDPQDVLREP
jgi:putative ABC transport system permease protein